MDNHTTAESGNDAKKKNSYKHILLLSLVILFGSGYFLTLNIIIVINHNKTVAVVTGVKQLSSSGNDKSYIPTVKFRTEKGRSISAQTLLGSSSYNYAIGAKVTVYYNPEAPHEFKIAHFLSMWVLPIGGLIVGSLIFKAAISIGKDELSGKL